MLQAKRNLAQAVDSAASGRYEWACLAAQQAAEIAVAALHLRHGQDVWGHVVGRSLEKLPGSVVAGAELIEWARNLDMPYIPTRHPNGLSAGAP